MDDSSDTLRVMQNFRELPTPCLVLDLDVFESNLRTMAEFVAKQGLAIRPHFKTHKCVRIAKRQIAEGAIGICTATIAEAELLVRNNVRGVLITAELVGEPKVSRFIEVLKTAPDTMLVVDSVDNANELQAATERAKLTADILIDLDVGQNRTGVLPGAPAQALAAHIAGCPNLRLVGICAYAGHLAHVESFHDRQEASRSAWRRALETRDALQRDGHQIRIMTGASTGTYNIDSSISGVTEIQAGSYVFMDVEYRTVHRDFRPALCVLATVIHRSEHKAIVDAGLKAFATDRSFGPELLDLERVPYEFAGDEHGRLNLVHCSKLVRLGDKLRFILPHCDPNVNLYDRIYCVKNDEVVDEWPIMERSGGYF